ncbi:MAG: NfeD family protein [Limnochordia bacterium]|jgi:membrane protein implicated in regulation of membrane protease activity
MADWQSWYALMAMLFLGEMAGVGCYLLFFALGALMAGTAALVTEVALDGQLDLFLASSGVLILWERGKSLMAKRRGNHKEGI